MPPLPALAVDAVAVVDAVVAAAAAWAFAAPAGGPVGSCHVVKANVVYVCVRLWT